MTNRTEAEIRAALVAEARTWVGTPYQPYGRRKGVEADCVFHHQVSRIVFGGGPDIPKRYSQMPSQRALEKAADASLILIACAEASPISFSALKPGQLALFVGRNPDEPQHFGMLAEYPKNPAWFSMIHAMGSEASGGEVVETIAVTPQSWGRFGEIRSMKRRLWKLYDFPGVTDGY